METSSITLETVSQSNVALNINYRFKFENLYPKYEWQGSAVRVIKAEKIRLKFKKNMIKVFFVDGSYLTLCADTVIKFGLKTGQEITNEEHKKTISCDKSKRAVLEALKLVSKRSYSSKGLQDKLIQRGYDPESTLKALGRLKELSYIDDAKFAESYASYLFEKGKGEFSIKAALKEQGLERSLIDMALSVIETGCPPHERIIEIMKIKFKNFNGKDSNEIRKIASFFIRRGFSFETVSKAFREYKNVFIDR